MHAASIEITQMGVDAGTRYVLTIGSGGTACQVTGLSQDYGAPDWKGPSALCRSAWPP